MQPKSYHRRAAAGSCLLSSSSAARAWALSSDLTKQTLSIRDARTGVPVHVVGTMHYNPHSIAKVESIVRAYGEGGKLGSVIVESCRDRWATTQRLQPKGSILRQILDNEFQAAAEARTEYGQDIRLVLADESIRDSDDRVRDAFASSVQDFVNPLGGGWTALATDIKRGYQSLDPSALEGADEKVEGEYLDLSDLLDSDMLRAAPISLLRYVLGTVIKKPVAGFLLLVWLSALLGYGVIHGLGDMSLADQATATVAGLVLNVVVGIPLLGRVLLVALLSDRNEILASNIRLECDRLCKDGQKDKVCVAVLGLAHCNGVKRLLCE